jgi:Family of unknown function (DUF5757)
MNILVEWVFQEAPKQVYVRRFPLDTDESLRARIMAQVDGVDQYTHFYTPITKDTTNIQVVSLYALIHPQRTTLMSLLKRFSKIFSKEDIATIWLQLTELPWDTVSLELLQAGLPEEYDYIYRQRSGDKYREQLDLQRQRQTQKTIVFESLDEAPQMQNTAITQTIRVAMLEFSSRAPMEFLLDSITTTDDFPVVSLGSIIKISKHSVNCYGLANVADSTKIQIAWVVGDLMQIIEILPWEEGYQIITEVNEIPFDKVKMALDKIFEMIRFTATSSATHKTLSETTIEFLLNINTRILSIVLLEFSFLEFFFAINENNVITKPFGSINLYFEDLIGQRVRIALHQKNGKTSFIISHKATRPDSIEYLLEKIVGVYYDNATEIIREFSQYGIYIDAQYDEETKSKTFLQANPILFGGDYSRRCQKDFKPTVVSSERALDLQQMGKQVIRFPKDNDAHVAEPQYYTCENPDIPYIGLIVNPDVELGFQPCCFKRDQSNQKKFKAYYEPASVPEDEVENKDYTLATDKLVPKNNIAFIPEKTRGVTNMLSTLVRYSGENIMRMGVERGPNSFLDCVCLAMGKTVDRYQLLKNTTPSIMAQETHDLTDAERQSFINSQEFLDPRKTIRLLEHVFDCNIFVFIRDNDHVYGDLMEPDYVNGYVQWEIMQNRPTVLVFMHYGAESEKRETEKYPQCELLLRNQAQEDNVSQFSTQSQLIRWIYSIYQKRYYSIFCRKFLVARISMDNLVAQHIDSFGKVVGLLYRWNNREIMVECTPLPPMNLPSFTHSGFVSSMDAIAFQNSQFPNTPYTQSSDMLRFQVNGIDFCIHTTNEMQNTLDEFVWNERQSRYVFNWFVFRYSEFLTTQQFSSSQIDSKIETFIQNKVRLNENFSYDQPPNPLFSVVPDFAVNGFTCSSLNLLRSLVFHLRILCTKTPDHVLKMRDQVFLPQFYTRVADYSTSSSEDVFLLTPNLQNHIAPLQPEILPLLFAPNDMEEFFLQHPKIKQNKIIRVWSEPDANINGRLFIFDGNVIHERWVTDDTEEWIVYRYNKQIHYRRFC